MLYRVTDKIGWMIQSQTTTDDPVIAEAVAACYRARADREMAETYGQAREHTVTVIEDED